MKKVKLDLMGLINIVSVVLLIVILFLVILNYKNCSSGNTERFQNGPTVPTGMAGPTVPTGMAGPTVPTGMTGPTVPTGDEPPPENQKKTPKVRVDMTKNEILKTGKKSSGRRETGALYTAKQEEGPNAEKEMNKLSDNTQTQPKGSGFLGYYKGGNFMNYRGCQR